MNALLIWNGRDHAKAIWTSDQDAAQVVYDSCKAAGWNVVWTIHGTTGPAHLMPGKEADYALWLDAQS